ncbi:sin3 complex subunit [Botryosphaeria dothidea]|uniref:Sin3 complex subunit n=1 Tax=Botryosphaeria dothidea TaxID=55169 RepID=A0A8H4MXF9_9PEZI|nr:sin3 complex subunit [Botryosphaeria dothidea]
MPRNALELEHHDGAPTVPQAGPISKDAEPRASLDARRDNTEGGQPAEQPPRGYLEEDPSTIVLDRRRVLEGYECYIVEQWACSRTHPTFVITTYTGDPSHKVVAGVLSVPTDEKAWSARLRIYFKALSQYHARSRDTPLGTLMITNLSAFPSSLTVIPVPGGDVRKHRESFFVNENLKRLGCSGRVGITLAPPSGATEYKFHQLYRTSEKIPLSGAVIELVKLCQVALVLFGKLEPEYADGLLCDVTEKAVNDWWVEIGNEYYSIEPHDGILGPTTVAALLGTLMGARNRLNAYGAPIGKDVFDVESTKRGIAYFQKSQRVQKTRRLDRKTLGLLHRATAKTASGEGWTVPKAVKSTVAELSGKGGEMVMDIVGGRDKAGIAEVETVDIERFVQLVHGERSKWLWYGKPRKHHGNMFNRLPDEDSKANRKESKHEDDLDPPPIQHRDTTTSEIAGLRKRETGTSIDKYSPDDKESRIKRATGKLGDARSGIGGRIKDAVGLRSHQHKHSRVENDAVLSGNDRSENALRQSSTAEDHTQYPPEPSPRESMEMSSAAEETVNDKLRKQQAQFTKILSETPQDSQPATAFQSKDNLPRGDEQPELGAILTNEGRALSRTDMAEDSIAGSIYRGIDLDTLFEANAQFEPGALLRRTNSFSNFITRRSFENRSDERWPRRLSLSIAEESLFRWQDVTHDPEADLADTTDPTKQLAYEQLAAEEARLNGERLTRLGNVVNAWVEGTINHVQELNVEAEHDQQELEEIYYPRLDEYNSLREESKEIISQERAALQDSIKDIETLGAKLEYEVNALRGKVEDVEDGVTEFERQVRVVEDMIRILEDECQPKEGWLGWIYRRVAGGGEKTKVET